MCALIVAPTPGSRRLSRLLGSSGIRKGALRWAGPPCSRFSGAGGCPCSSSTAACRRASAFV
eukprot:5130741-Alexandrium_andersonii.AAC.1